MIFNHNTFVLNYFLLVLIRYTVRFNKEKNMKYEIDAMSNESGWFKGAHEKMGKEFEKISSKRVKDGWTFHSYNHVNDVKSILTTLVWQKD